MGGRPLIRLAVGTGVAVTATMLVSGCSTDSSIAPSSKPVDVCNLISEPDVAAAMGAVSLTPKDLSVTAKDLSTSGRPGCRWTHHEPSPDGGRAIITLWHPPAPQALASGDPKIRIGGQIAYVEARDGGYCTLQVRAALAWMRVEIDVYPPPPPPRDACSFARPLALEALTGLKNVGWPVKLHRSGKKRHPSTSGETASAATVATRLPNARRVSKTA